MFKKLLLCLILPLSFLYAKDELVICTIFRNEAPWIKEWLDYHIHNGVDKFYLYNHLSEDNYLEVLAPYIKKGKVEIIDWPYPEWPKAQFDVIRDAIGRIRGKAKWVAMIDSDEFIVCDEKKITKFLKHYKDAAGVVMHWQIFGTSGVADLKGDSVLRNMILKAPEQYDDPRWMSNQFVKSIIQPDRINEFSTNRFCGNHVFEPIDGYQMVDEFNMPIILECKRCPVTTSKIQLNHYFFRDEKFFYEKKIRLRETAGYTYPPGLVEEMVRDCNQVTDLRIQKRIPK